MMASGISKALEAMTLKDFNEVAHVQKSFLEVKASTQTRISLSVVSKLKKVFGKRREVSEADLVDAEVRSLKGI